MQVSLLHALREEDVSSRCSPLLTRNSSQGILGAGEVRGTVVVMVYTNKEPALIADRDISSFGNLTLLLNSENQVILAALVREVPRLSDSVVKVSSCCGNLNIMS